VSAEAVHVVEQIQRALGMTDVVAALDDDQAEQRTAESEGWSSTSTARRP
jgi:hypothetical protein